MEGRSGLGFRAAALTLKQLATLALERPQYETIYTADSTKTKAEHSFLSCEVCTPRISRIPSLSTSHRQFAAPSWRQLRRLNGQPPPPSVPCRAHILRTLSAHTMTSNAFTTRDTDSGYSITTIPDTTVTTVNASTTTNYYIVLLHYYYNNRRS